MYEAFYGFKEKPFSMLPDPSFLFLSKKHRTALTLLEYGLLNHVGFCVISGEPGAGKTTILRALLERVPDNVTVGLITNTHQSFGGVLDWILSAFDLHQPDLTHVERHQVFMDYLIEEYANNRNVLLIIDEAQNMEVEALEELRMLSNVNSEKDQLLQVMLAGQPALKDTLRKPELMQFAQRIAVDYHLEPLGVKETCGYIQHRLVTAGAERDIFTPAACERIHSYSGGTPRLINLLCETVLVYGFADQLDMIDVDLVDEMVQERMKDSVVPIVNRDAGEKDNKLASKELEKDFPWIKSMIEKQGLRAKTETSVDNTPVIPVVKEPAKQASTIVDEPTVIKSADKTAVIDDKLSYVNAGAKKPVEPEKKTTLAERQSSQEIPLKTQQKAPQKIQDDNLEASFTTQVEGKEGKEGKSLVKNAIFSVFIVTVLIVLALLFSGKISTGEVINWATNKYKETTGALELQKQSEQEEARLKKLQIEAEALIKQREQEEARVKKLQTEAEALKKERDAAIVKAEKEKRDKQQAEKLAVEKSALAAKAAEEKRLAEIKKSEQLIKQRKAKARAEANRARAEVAKLAKEKALMEARLAEERELKLKLQQDASRLAREQQEIQRQQQLLQQQKAKIQAEQLAAAEAAAIAAAKAKEEAESKPSECNGPAARYKAICR